MGRSTRSTHLFFCVLFVGLLLMAPCVYCQTDTAPPQTSEIAQNTTPSPLTQLSLEQLGNIQVTTASKEPEAVWKTAAAIYVITQEDIRRSGVTSIPEALRLAPGVDVGRISSNTWAIGIRGLQSNFSKSVLVLIDGRSVFTPLFAGVYWDQQDVPLEDIDRIEVIRGPGGTIWGPNAVNGVINIITKNAADTRGTLVDVTAGSTDRIEPTARYGGGSAQGFSYRVFGKGFIREPGFHPDHDDYDEWHQERGGFRMDWNEDRDSYTVQGMFYQGDSPRKVSLETFNPLSGGKFTTEDPMSGGDLLARWRRDLGNDSNIYLQIYFDRTIRGGLQFNESRDTIDIDFLHRLHLGSRNALTYGAGLRWSPYLFIQTNDTINLTDDRDTDHLHSGFVQDEFQIVPDRLSVIGGLKLEHNNFSGFDAQPTVRFLWTPGKHQSFWAAVTRAVTTPSRIEEDFKLRALAAFNPTTFIGVSGNPNFTSESLLGYEGGYRQLFGNALYVDLDVFHNDYSNLQSFEAPTVSFESDPAPPHVLLNTVYGNAIAGATDGFEIAPTWTPSTRWKLSGSYSFMTAGLHASGATVSPSSTGSIATYEGSSPRNQLEARSYLTLPRGFEFDQTYRYASALPAQSVRAYQTADVRLGWNYHDLQFSIDGQNLFQPYHYEWGTGDPSIPNIGIRRSAYARIVWTSSR